MAIKRKLVRIETPKPQRGFLGPDYTARAVITGGLSASDPFILLMDDYLDKKDNTPVGLPLYSAKRTPSLPAVNFSSLVAFSVPISNHPTR